MGGDANARIFSPKGTEYIDENSNIDATNMTYSATWDSGYDIQHPLRIGIPVCLYDRTKTPPRLIVNQFMLFGNQKVLFGIKDGNQCPLPGSKLLSGYSGSYTVGILGDFLVSGAVCVVNSVMFDSMFRLYCTIVLWFYSILYAMIIIYIMFYGISIMLGIGRDPIKEAPKRIVKILIIFTLATNSQMGFRYIHQFFLAVLNHFDDFMSISQPLYTADGQPAYKTFGDLDDFLSYFSGLNLTSVYKNDKLLDESGHIWKPLPLGTVYYDMADLDADGNPSRKTINRVPDGYTTLEPDKVNTYTPFRIPNMQWTYVEDPKDSGQYKILPVFEEVYAKDHVDFTQFAQPTTVCITDMIWNPEALNKDGTPVMTQVGGKSMPGRLEKLPRCQKNLWRSIPNVTPYGEYCLYEITDSGFLVPPQTQSKGCYSNTPNIYPTRLADVSYTDQPSGEVCEMGVNSDGTCIGNLTNDSNGDGLYEATYSKVDQSKLEDECSDITFWNCRKAFQGVLGRIDAQFSAILGDDNSKSIGALASALVFWGFGGGIILSMFLMTGVLTMLIAFVQTMFVYITAVMCLTMLLMLSPIFISCLLFKTTERFFNGWLASLISYSMQPFLITAFIYMLSSVTTMNRLVELAKHETSMKLYHVNTGTDNISGGYFWASSFKEPLYEKPVDYDNHFYESGKNNGEPFTDLNNNHVHDPNEPYYDTNHNGKYDENVVIEYITGEQRKAYLDRRGNEILADYTYALCNCGINASNIYKAENKKKFDDWDKANPSVISDLKNLWNNGIYPGGTQSTEKRGIQAIVDYNIGHGDYYANVVSFYRSQLIPRLPKANVTASCDKVHLFTSSELDTLRNTGYTFNTETTSASCTFTLDNPAIEASENDGDAYVGEPEAIVAIKDAATGKTTDKPASREFPVCKVNCPVFIPAYNPTDSKTTSPQVEAPVSETWPDATPCPVARDANGKVIQEGGKDKISTCAPNAQCVKNCMTVPHNLNNNFKYLFAAIMTWILLNMVTSAFMSKVPAIAASLSNWQNYGGGEGATPIQLGGASLSRSKMVDRGMAVSGMYTGSGIIDSMGSIGYDFMKKHVLSVDPNTGIITDTPMSWRQMQQNPGMKSDELAPFAEQFNSFMGVDKNSQSATNVYNGTMKDDLTRVGVQLDRQSLWKLATKELIGKSDYGNLSKNASADQIRQAMQKYIDKKIAESQKGN